MHFHNVDGVSDHSVMLYSFACLFFYLLLDNTTNATEILLDAGNHTEISQSTKSASNQWRAIGGKLGFTFDELDSIVHEPGRCGDVDYYEAMLRRWLDWAPPKHPFPSLQSLLTALRDVGKERLAYDLEAKYRK